jgi:hypothetical protein
MRHTAAMRRLCVMLRYRSRRLRPGGGAGRCGRIGRVVGTLLVCAALAAGASAAVRAARSEVGHLTVPAITAPEAGGVTAESAAPASHDYGSASSRAHDSGNAPRPRPFDHERHEAVSCTACHGTGVNHRTLLVRSSRDCAACHHGGVRACVGCHASGSLPKSGTVLRDLSLGVWPATRMRELPFAHSLHAGITCRECHRTPVTLAMDRSCGSCHESHHRPETECTACHSPPGQPVHGAAVHLSCGGTGCHAPAVAPSPALSRSLCIACHEQQRTHEPGNDCSGCHLIRSGTE